MTPADEEIKALCDRWTLPFDFGGPAMERSETGEFVRYSDHATQVAELRAERDKAERKLVESRDKAATYLRHRDRLKSALRGAHDAFDTIKECAKNCIHASGQMTNYSTAKYGLSLVEAALSGSDVKETAREGGDV